MREIKFRTFDKIHKEMLYYDIFDSSESTEVMQYTGLKYTNGKEIYEGDIVETDYIEHKIIYNIEYFNGSYNAINKYGVYKKLS